MVICPMCEHQQQFGLECEQCGKELGDLAGLGGLGPPPVSAQPVEGLELTVPARVGEVAVERVGELEVTRFAAVSAATEVTPDLELSRAPDVGEVPVERLQDLSEDRVADDGVRTAPLQGAVACRFCNTVGPLGTVCVRCGYKLPAAQGPSAGPAKAPQGVSTRCRACGAPATAGERCGDCGHEVAFPDA